MTTYNIIIINASSSFFFSNNDGCDYVIKYDDEMLFYYVCCLPSSPIPKQREAVTPKESKGKNHRHNTQRIAKIQFKSINIENTRPSKLENTGASTTPFQGLATNKRFKDFVSHIKSRGFSPKHVMLSEVLVANVAQGEAVRQIPPQPSANQ